MIFFVALQCREIGENAMAFYKKYVARDALLDYVEMVCKQISKRYVAPPAWYVPPPPEASPPELRKPDDKCFMDKKTRTSKYCKRCQEEVDEEEKEKKEEEKRAKLKRKDKGKVKQSLRERMKKRAKLAAEKKK